MDAGGITDISNLPKEVLEIIFDHLPFRTRQNAKSVCRHWLGILLGQKYRKQEKIVVRGFYPFEEILDVLSKYNGGLQHLEFQNVYLDAEKFDSSFWIAHGAQIKELRFDGCKTDPETTFLCMALHCANLESLYWHDSKYEDQKTCTLICSSEMLDVLIHSIKFSHKNLLVFETDVVSIHWLYKFRKVFPNAERISYLLDSSLYVEGNEKETRRIRSTDDGDELNLPKISEKKLSVEFRDLSVDFVRRTLISAYELRRLQEIEMNAVSMDEFPRDEFLHIVRQQPLLEKFEFCALRLEPTEILNFGESLLESLFETSPKLQRLSLALGGSYNLMINATLFLKMKSSQLSYLMLECSGIRFEKVLYNKTPRYENVQKNHTLRHLRVGSRLESVDDIHLLLQSFSRLEHLEINIDMDWFSSNEVLNSIVTHQSRLKSLRLFHPFGPDCVSIHQFHQLGELKNLKYLFMDFDNGRCSQKGPTEFQLPSSLEYLYVDLVLDDLEVFQAWLNALTKNQELRALYFWHSPIVGIPFESWLKFCSSMKNLEYLCIPPRCGDKPPDEAFNEEEFKKLFHASPSLRVISQVRILCDSSSDTSAVYNRATGEIFIDKNMTLCRTYFIRNNSNYDYYDVDWLEF